MYSPPSYLSYISPFFVLALPPSVLNYSTCFRQRTSYREGKNDTTTFHFDFRPLDSPFALFFVPLSLLCLGYLSFVCLYIRFRIVNHRSRRVSAVRLFLVQRRVHRQTDKSPARTHKWAPPSARGPNEGALATALLWKFIIHFTGAVYVLGLSRPICSSEWRPMVVRAFLQSVIFI